MWGWALIFALAVAGGAGAQNSLEAYRPPSDCARYIPAAECNNWVLAPWLPQYSSDAFVPWRKNEATSIATADGITYAGQTLGGKLGLYLPHDGSPFTYGKAGPPRGQVVYDARHKIALYGQGCCSWAEVVLAANVPPPPRRVTERDLSGLHTLRGVRLGMNASQVQAIYGPASLRRDASFPEIQQLAYSTIPPQQKDDTSNACGQSENFYFRRNRLILIQIANGC